MTRFSDIGAGLLQMLVLVICAPLVTGLIQKLKARLQVRAGAGILQPYRDLAKLWRKATVESDSASVLFRAVPPLVLAATMCAAAMVPVLFTAGAVPGAGGPAIPLGDAILLLSLLALARFMTAIGALDAGGAFGGMGASREMTVGVLVEPVMMLVIFSVTMAGGTTDLAELAARREQGIPPFGAADLLALFSMLVLLCAETGRIPVDNPDTHLELTMLHEGMLLEHSGPGLACMLLATHVKQLVAIALVAAVFFPAGLAARATAPDIALAAAAFAGKALLFAFFLGVVESSYAKLRLFRLPHLLGIGFVTAFLALALRTL